MNYYNEEEDNKYIIKDIIFLFIFLIPNSLAIIHSHYIGRIMNFFFRNYILTSLLPLYYNMDFLIVLLGLFNILLMINLYSADEKTYRNFRFWFYLFGIQRMSYY